MLSRGEGTLVTCACAQQVEMSRLAKFFMILSQRLGQAQDLSILRVRG